MANIKSAKKRIKIAERNAARNKAYKSSMKTLIKKANVALESGAENSQEALKAAIAKIDRAVVKGVLHKNNAARKKSSLAKKATSLQKKEA